jgi:hypothetical protein
MARLVDRNTGEECAECNDLNAPPQAAVKVVVAGSRRLPLCQKHLEPLLDDCAAYMLRKS